MSTHIHASRPRASGRFTRGTRHQRLQPLDRFRSRHGRALNLLALPTGQDETPIDDGGAETPLRREVPRRRDEGVAQNSLCETAWTMVPRSRGGIGGLGDEKRDEGESGPEPADFDKVQIEDVVFACEVVDRVRGEVEFGCDGGCERVRVVVSVVAG